MKFSSREGLFAYAKGLGDHLNLISVPRDRPISSFWVTLIPGVQRTEGLPPK